MGNKRLTEFSSSALEPTSVRSDPVIDRMPEQTTEDGYVEKWYQPPKAGNTQHDVPVGLETGQRALVRQHQIERLLHLLVTDDIRRAGPEIAYLDLSQP